MTIMNITNFQLLSMIELESFWSELDFAIDEHNRWLNNLNRTLLFSRKARGDDIADDAHLRYHFGRWYQGHEGSPIMDLPSFIEIGVIHQEIHAVAREILVEIEKDGDINQQEYDRLISLSEKLRCATNELKRDIKTDIGTISMLLSKVFEHASEGVVITTADATILNVNKAFTKLTGFNHEEAVGNNPNILFSGRHDKDFFKKMWHDLGTLGFWEGEIWDRKKGGELYPAHLNISALTDNNGEASHYIGIFTDISSEDNNQQRLYRLAHFDPLTELPNRVLFYDRLHHAIAVAKRAESNIAVLFMDLDGFKEINDRFGHEEGDNLLREVTCRIIKSLRESDTVSRFGGDEFTVVLPEIGSNKNLNAVASKIIAAVDAPYQIASEEVDITISIGSTLYPDTADSADLLIRQADLAMYAAKKGGKNRFCRYTENMG